MDLIKLENIKNLILEIRNEKVLIDSDVAQLYNVTTKAIKQYPTILKNFQLDIFLN